MNKKTGNDDDQIVIKKYANRRLYNTESSSYVTLDYLCEMVKEGKDFVVYDAKSGEDITRSVLTQIIVEKESKGASLLPIQFLRQLIQFYGDSLEGMVPSYLEMSMESFADNQEKMREQMRDAFGGGGLEAFEDLTRRNLSLFEQAMRVFSPYGGNGEGNSDEEAVAGDAPVQSSENEISTLKDQLAAMQKQLDALANKDD